MPSSSVAAVRVTVSGWPATGAVTSMLPGAEGARLLVTLTAPLDTHVELVKPRSSFARTCTSTVFVPAGTVSCWVATVPLARLCQAPPSSRYCQV